MIRHIFGLTRKNTQKITKNLYFFAKGDKEQKGGKPEKGGKKEEAPPAPVIEQISPQQKLRAYLTPLQNCLSPKQVEIMTQGFNDLSQDEKKMLDSFADEILDLKTPSFVEFMRWGGLGTGEAYYVATNPPSDQELSNSITSLKKQ